MTNNELFEKLQVLSNPTLKDIESFKVNYAIEKNKRDMSTEVDLIRSQLSKVDKYFEYFNGRATLEQKLQNAEPEDRDTVLKEFKEYNETYIDTIKKVGEILNTENDYKFYKIKISDVPEKLSDVNTRILFDLITE
jgi:hypothetical protein